MVMGWDKFWKVKPYFMELQDSRSVPGRTIAGTQGWGGQAKCGCRWNRERRLNDHQETWCQHTLHLVLQSPEPPTCQWAGWAGCPLGPFPPRHHGRTGGASRGWARELTFLSMAIPGSLFPLSGNTRPAVPWATEIVWTTNMRITEKCKNKRAKLKWIDVWLNTYKI